MGTDLLAEVAIENMAALQLFNLGESVGMLPREILVFWGIPGILVHSEAYRAC